jgi:hypothetical protein
VAFSSLVLLNIQTMGKVLNLSGKIYGRLTVISRTENRGKRQYVAWDCLCSCGKNHVTTTAKLVKGATRSCGCLQRDLISNLTRKHSDTKSKEYNSWSHIKSRCTNPNNAGYKWYGARGIKMHPEWVESYESFLNHVGRAPSKEHSIDRVDNNGHYVPGNVRWATKREQVNNRRTTTYLEYNGEKRPFTEWCEVLNINYRVLRTRLGFGWTVERALSTPVKSRT